MPMRFFKKMGVSPVPIPDGRSVPFKTLDGLQGFLATEDPSLWTAFETCMREGRSGITEIPWADFDRDYVKKKSNAPPLNPLWREEISRGMVMPSSSQLTERLKAAQDVVAVANVPPPAPPPSPSAISHAQSAVNAGIAKALPTVADYKPEVGKRKRAKT